MRRRVLTVLIIGAIIAALGAAEQASVRRVTDASLEQTQAILSDIREGALAQAMQKARALDMAWDERAGRLDMMVSHQSTDDVRYALSRLIAALECEDRASAMIYASELEGGIEHVEERQRISIQNIL